MSFESFLRGVGWVVVAYATSGTAFAAFLQVRGLSSLDPGTRGTPVVFRLVLLPGMIALWPWLAWQWKNLARRRGFRPAEDLSVAPRRLRATHRLGWQALAVLAPLLLALALSQRPPPIPRTPQFPRAPGAEQSPFPESPTTPTAAPQP